MSFLEKAKEAAESKIIELFVIAITVLLGWIFSFIAPAIKNAILAEVSVQVFLPVLLLSLLINLVLLVVLFLVVRKHDNSLELRYGVYWDKQRNPYCPVCQKPVLYDDWGVGGIGYYCQPCKQVTSLQDGQGNKKKPNQVFD